MQSTKKPNEDLRLAIVGFMVAALASIILVFWIIHGFSGESFAQNMKGQWALELLPFLLVAIIGGIGSAIIGVIHMRRAPTEDGKK